MQTKVARGTTLNSAQLAELITPLLGDERLDRFDSVIGNRTFNVLPIVEGLYDMGNLAAIVRSADALGFGAVHSIKNDRYKQSKRASGGAEKWLDVKLWDSTQECLTAAREMGYQILATHLSPTAKDITEVDWTRPTAFVLGNEKEGVSEAALAMADAHVVVPMVGFVESFNVSVAASLILYQARATRLQKLGSHGDLSEEERRILRTLMMLRHKGRTREMVTHLLNRPPPDWQIFRGHGDWGGKFATVPVPSETRCHYWDGQQCWGEELIFPGKTCTHSAGHRPGVTSLNKHKLRHMCETKGLPLPPVVLAETGRGSKAGPEGGAHSRAAVDSGAATAAAVAAGSASLAAPAAQCVSEEAAVGGIDTVGQHKHSPGRPGISSVEINGGASAQQLYQLAQGEAPGQEAGSRRLKEMLLL
ncbi:hypothetical protein N2152v2_005271 [Parachlorella kessleri]